MSGPRQIVVFDRVSADGYFSAPDGSLNWVVPDPDIDKEGAAGVPGTGTLLFGRRTYDMFEKFWPNVQGDGPTAPDPHSPGRYTPEMRAFAAMINSAEKIVFSRTRQSVTWNNSRLIKELDPEEIRRLKEQPGKSMMIFGSGSIVSQLTQLRLVDEYHFIVGPMLLGGGKSLVGGVPSPTKLELVEAKPFASGNIRLRYRLAA
jgi:dihydrofolate reductase